MPYDGNGNYVAPSNSWNPAVGGTTIDSADWNSTQSDYETALSSVITKDGQTTITANLPMSGFKHTGVNPNSGSTSRTEYTSGATLQDGAPLDAGLTAGSSTVYTATLSPAITAYADKQCFRVQFDEACGASPTINFNSVGAKKIYKNVAGTGVQLSAGDVSANFVAELRYDTALDSAAGGFWLLNPLLSPNNLSGLVLGQCVLSYTDTTTLTLSRFNGDRIFINGVFVSVPSTGPTIAPTALTPGTLYYIYAYNNSGTLTLEASTTVPVADTTYGNQIKTGDATRVLVGMERVATGPIWEGLCRSWYNDPGFINTKSFTANRSTSSATLAEINSEIRTSFLVFTGEKVLVSADGAVSCVDVGGGANTKFSFDGGATENAWSRGRAAVANYIWPVALSFNKSGLSQGAHYVTLFGSTNFIATTATWEGSATDTNLRIYIAPRT